MRSKWKSDSYGVLPLQCSRSNSLYGLPLRTSLSTALLAFSGMRFHLRLPSDPRYWRV